MAKKCERMGCANPATIKGRCDTHSSTTTSLSTANIKNDWHRLYGTAWWKRARGVQLNRQPLCQSCLRHDRTTVATDVDHIMPHRGDDEMFRDTSMYQSLCHRCHSVKTQAESRGVVYDYNSGVVRDEHGRVTKGMPSSLGNNITKLS